MIALIDYGAGNLTSVRKALETLGAGFATPRKPADLDSVRGIIVPGVGHFDATRAIDGEWRAAIRSAIDRGVALLGICLGMQWLYEGSEEAPGLEGLSVFAGRCTRLGNKGHSALGTAHSALSTPHSALKIPHVGWNNLDISRPTTLMTGVPTGAQVYFTHSYVAPVTADTTATTTYDTTFASAVARGRLAGVQFHPEKSGDIGLRILRNWLAVSATI